jgi:hypothetical protein
MLPDYVELSLEAEIISLNLTVLAIACNKLLISKEDDEYLDRNFGQGKLPIDIDVRETPYCCRDKNVGSIRLITMRRLGLIKVPVIFEEAFVESFFKLVFVTGVANVTSVFKKKKRKKRSD